jgi:hypothetical protein
MYGARVDILHNPRLRRLSDRRKITNIAKEASIMAEDDAENPSRGEHNPTQTRRPEDGQIRSNRDFDVFEDPLKISKAMAKNPNPRRVKP